MKPGKPLWFGVRREAEGLNRTLVFGLPGNPVSSFVGFELFVKPAIARLGGRDVGGSPNTISARLTTEFAASRRSRDLSSGDLERRRGNGHAAPLGRLRRSPRARRCERSDCLSRRRSKLRRGRSDRSALARRPIAVTPCDKWRRGADCDKVFRATIVPLLGGCPNRPNSAKNRDDGRQAVLAATGAMHCLAAAERVELSAHRRSRRSASSGTVSRPLLHPCLGAIGLQPRIVAARSFPR